MELRVVENREKRRFEMALTDGSMALIDYQDHGDRLVLTHTEVPAHLSGQGLAAKLSKGTFQQLQESGRKVELRCSYLVHYIARHPEFAGLVA